MEIDQLNFKVILHDEDFDKSSKKLLEQAKRLNKELSQLLEIQRNVDRIVTPEDIQNNAILNQLLEQRAKTETKLNNRRKKKVELEQQITQELQKQSRLSNIPQVINIDNSKHIERAQQAQQVYNAELTRTSRLMMQIKNLTLTYFSVLTATRVVSNLVRVSAEFEKQRVSLEAILRDAQGADRIFEQIKDLAVISPFTFKELATYTKQLSAFSVPMSELFETTKMLADVSAGLGVGMDRLILAYGQIRSASFLRGQEVRQLTEAGVPILKELSKQLTEIEGKYVSVGEVFDKISSRQVTFEMVEKVFKEMTEEGGKFYQMQETLAATLAGKLSNLTDAYQIMFSEIGEKQSGLIVGTVDALRGLATNYEEVGRTLLKLVAVYGTYRAAVIALQAVENARYFATLARGAGAALSSVEALGMGLGSMVKHSKAFAAVNALISKINPYAALAAGAVAAGFAIYKAATAQNQLQRSLKEVNNAVNTFNSDISEERIKLNYLFNQLKNAQKGTEDYEKAKKKILSTYDAYLTDLDRENLALGQQETLYRNLTIAIRAAAKEKAMTEGMQGISTILTEELNDITAKLGKLEARPGFTQAIAEQIADYIYGDTTWDKLTVEAQAFINSVNKKSKEVIEASKNGAWIDSDLFINIEDLKNKYEQAGKIADEAQERLKKELNIRFGTQTSGEKQILDNWQEDIVKIREEAKKEGITLNIQPEKLSLDAAVQEVRKQINELTESEKINRGINDEVADKLHEQLVYFQKINKEVLKGRATANTKGAGGTTANPRIREIQDEIAVYKLLKDEMSSVEDAFGKQNAKTYVETLYKDIYPEQAFKDFDAAVETLIAELATLGDEGVEAAQKIRASFAQDSTKAIIQSIRAAEKYREEMEKWLQKDFGLAGEDIGFDVSKIIAGLFTANNGTDAAVKALKASVDESEAYIRQKAKAAGLDADAVWTKYRDEAYAQIDAIAGKEREANKKTAQEKVNDLANAYVKGAITNKFGTNKVLSDWGDKSIAQISDIIRGLKDVEEKGLGDIPEDVKKRAEEAGISLEKLWALIKEILENDIENATVEQMKKIGAVASSITGAVSGISSALLKLGEATENGAVKALGEALDTAKQIADIVLDCSSAMREFADVSSEATDEVKNIANSADWITMIVKIVLLFVTKIVDGISNAITETKQLERAMRSAADSLVSTFADISRKSFSGLFGTDQIGLLAKNIQIAAEVEKELAEMVNKQQHGSRGRYKDIYSESYAREMEVLRAQLSAGVFKDQDDIALYEHRLAIYDAWVAANEDLKKSYEDLFSTLTTDWVDSLLSNFDEVGDAVSNLDDAFSNFGETILRSVLNSYLLQNVLSKYEKDFTNLIDSYAQSSQGEQDAMRLAQEAGELAGKVKGDIAWLGDALNAIIGAFRDNGLHKAEENTGNNLSTGIQGVTEDTANLLASYINAMRADLAANRLTLEGMSADLKLILGLLPSTPTLAEYLTQIEANTANNAEAAQGILARLDSVIGDGATSFVKIS